MKLKALIAVRSGSVRVEAKNIRPFAGTTLLDYKIQQLLGIDSLDGIVVNSNDDHILEIASKYNVELVKRDPYFASNEVSMSEVYKNMAENMDADVIMYANVTSPLIKTLTITEMIKEYKKRCYEDECYDSVNSVHQIKEFLFMNGKALNYDPENQPRSQDLPEIFAINFGISILAKEKMVLLKNVVGGNPFLFEVSEIESTDIDTLLDFKVAEYLFRETYKTI